MWMYTHLYFRMFESLGECPPESDGKKAVIMAWEIIVVFLLLFLFCFNCVQLECCRCFSGFGLWCLNFR